MILTSLTEKLNRAIGRRDGCVSDITNHQRNLKDLEQKLDDRENAKLIIQECSQLTQQGMEFKVNEFVSIALASVFEDPYKFVLEFVQRRNKTEADLYFTKNEHRADPMDSSGFGAVDIASFALRIISWTIQNNQSRPTIILDEPFRNLSRDMHIKASRMVKAICDQKNIQVIMISHSEDMMEAADANFHVTKINGVSKVTKR